MQHKIAEEGYSVITMITYSNMDNYENAENFLGKCETGETGSLVMYEIYSDGSIGRMKYIFDGKDMYFLNAQAVWDEAEKPYITGISYARIKQWDYTEKGWFCYLLCVPEYPEVAEAVDGSRMIRVKPVSDELREVSEKCVLRLGYQGSNLLCSNRALSHMEEIDYNGLYEYLYAEKYGEMFNSDNYSNGISQEEFEALITEFLPVTAEQVREHAVYDAENQTYEYARLSCGNYSPNRFGTAAAEVVSIEENADGTTDLLADAVCEAFTHDEAVITHKLTVKLREDGSFQYLGNQILNDGINNIPSYQYRIKKQCED